MIPFEVLTDHESADLLQNVLLKFKNNEYLLTSAKFQVWNNVQNIWSLQMAQNMNKGWQWSYFDALETVCRMHSTTTSANVNKCNWIKSALNQLG